MRFFVLSDNTDTLIGMRLAGMEGTLIHTKPSSRKPSVPPCPTRGSGC